MAREEQFEGGKEQGMYHLISQEGTLNTEQPLTSCFSHIRTTPIVHRPSCHVSTTSERSWKMVKHSRRSGDYWK